MSGKFTIGIVTTEIYIYSTKTSINVCRYDTNDPSVKETIQASRVELEVRTEAEGGGWAEESLGIIKMIVYCTHDKM